MINMNLWKKLDHKQNKKKKKWTAEASSITHDLKWRPEKKKTHIP